jgi:hypothetical protein
MTTTAEGTDIEKRLKELEGKAAQAEKWLWVVSIVAGVFALTGAGIWQKLEAAQTQAAQAKATASKAVADLQTARDDATKAIKAASGAILESHRPAFDKWVADAQSKMDRWPSGSYAIFRGKNAGCPTGFQQVDTFVHAVASFMPNPGDGSASAYIKEREFGASSIKCHGGANCAAYNRPAPINVNWLADVDLSICVKEQ